MRTPGFYPEPVLVGFVVDKMTVGQAFLLVFQFYFPCLHFIYDPCLFSSMCFYYQKNTRANLRILVSLGLYEDPPFLCSCFSNFKQPLPISGVPSKHFQTLSTLVLLLKVERERDRERDHTLCLFRHCPRL
jgi:hypothetical protein